jgi:hypothetical protein
MEMARLAEWPTTKSPRANFLKVRFHWSLLVSTRRLLLTSQATTARLWAANRGTPTMMKTTALSLILGTMFCVGAAQAQPAKLTSMQMDAVTAGVAEPNVETFAVQFQKLSLVVDLALVDKQINVDARVKGNSAIADAKGESTAIGPNSHAETLALTSTTAVQGVGSSSSSIAQSVAAASPSHFYFHK